MMEGHQVSRAGSTEGVETHQLLVTRPQDPGKDVSRRPIMLGFFDQVLKRSKLIDVAIHWVMKILHVIRMIPDRQRSFVVPSYLRFHKHDVGKRL